MSSAKDNLLLSDKSGIPSASLLSAPGFFLHNMDLLDATRLLRRRLPLILEIISAFALLSLLLALMLPPRYKAEAVVMVDPRQTRVVDVGSVVSGLPVENTALRSEIDIITSRAVIDRVVDKMELMNDEEFNPKNPFSLFSPARWFRKGSSSEEDLERAHTRVANAIAQRLSVVNDGHSYSIHIGFASENARKAAAIANAFANEYLVDQLEAKYEATSRATKWLDERLGTLKKQVEDSEGAVQKFREENKIIEVGGSTIAEKQMEEINRQLVEARGQISQAEARYRSAENLVSSRGGIDSAADVLSSPLIQRLREQEAEVRRKEAEMATRYGELHPKMQDIKAEYRDLQNKIAEEVHKIVQGLSNEVDVARAKERQLNSDLDTLKARANVEMRDSIQLRQLQREADANRTLYETFLNRFKQTSEQQDMQVADSRIIAKADVPLKAAFPVLWIFLLVGLIVGTVTALAVAYLLEYFDRGFRGANQVETYTQLPVIGVIPSLQGMTKKTPEDYVLEKPLSSYSEALRSVRTAIHFSNVDKPPRTVMVTSSTPGEGKTTFCLSLARSLSKAGNKVLLIDADLRRPRVASAVGLKDTRGGLAAILAGEKTFKDVLVRDPKAPGLDLIPAAGKAPNAQDLLGSNQMRKLVDEAAEKYDLVLIDTPPILAVSDAAMAARMADTTLFVVHWATTPRDAVLRAVKQLAQFGCRIAGVVLACVDTKEQVKYGEEYYHRDYHGYYTD